MNRSRLVGPGRLALTALVAAGLVTGAVLSPSVEGVTANADPASATKLEPVVSAALSCPGPEFSGITGVEDIDVPARVGAATVPDSLIDSTVRITGKGQLLVRSGKDSTDPVTRRGRTTTTDELASGKASDVVATGALAPGLAATQEWAVARPEIRGLATVSCAGPGSDLWLLAGGGAAGRQERLILTNTGANEVTVDLQVLGGKGVVPSPTGSTVVPARGRVALLVDAITGAESSPAVRVRATGGSVRAVMSDIWLDGSIPAGAETTVPTAAPSRRQIIPAAIMAGTGSIRIAVPDQQQAVVSARFIGKDGPVPLPGGGVTRVPGRSTGELALTGLTQGTYAIELTSDVPIVASLWASWRSGTAPGDFIWAPSTTAATGLLGGAFPQAEEAHRRILNVVSTAGPAKVKVTWQAKDEWTTRSVDLDQDTSTSLDLGDAQSVWVQRVSGTGEIRAGVGTIMGRANQLVSVSPLVETAVTSQVGSAHPVS
ncbi:putative secreted protein [Janibacter sp. HTCC2649]|uniref:DUF5719 family protein n=1 Tax=Janibacter sp. HTCC2649 TaxID=313589 RepID=UPI0000670ED3|nr:DUF5719 family protein [Janibacter sp. HTCC2649]EAP97538.1 putative secreted protein [Janibacter sp. HTCC2649]